MVMTTELHWLARPHLFSWLFFLGTVWFCERIPRQGWNGGNFALVFLSAGVWANFHASFFLGPIIVSSSTQSALISKPLLWEKSRGRARAGPEIVETSIRQSGSPRFLGTFVNPNGWQLHRHVVSLSLEFRN